MKTTTATYWPRPSNRATPLPPDLELHRPCLACGYDLCGLPVKHPCPECGSRNGRVEFDPFPWELRQTPRAFVATLHMLLTKPDDAAMHLWDTHRPHHAPAARFRRINITIAAICFSCLALVWSYQSLATTSPHPLAGALACWPIQIASLIVGLDRLTNARLAFAKENSVQFPVMDRMRLLNSYLSAGLMLSPLHFLILPLSSWFYARQGDAFESLAMHLPLLLFQILLFVPIDARIYPHFMDSPRPFGWFTAIFAPPMSLLFASGYLAFAPAFAVVLMRHTVAA